MLITDRNHKKQSWLIWKMQSFIEISATFSGDQALPIIIDYKIRKPCSTRFLHNYVLSANYRESKFVFCYQENPFSQRFSSTKLRESKWILAIIIIQSNMTRIHGFLQNSAGRIQMDSHTWSQISYPEPKKLWKKKSNSAAVDNFSKLYMCLFTFWIAQYNHTAKRYAFCVWSLTIHSWKSCTTVWWCWVFGVSVQLFYVTDILCFSFIFDSRST